MASRRTDPAAGCAEGPVDPVLCQFGTVVAWAAGGPGGAHPPGALSAVQERRAKELLLANLRGGISLDDLARACGLSRSQFSRAFRKRVGMTAHRWRTLRRIALAKRYLLAGDLTLTTVALECGFADQSHFTRTFSRVVGSTPGRWRTRSGL